MYFLIIAVTPLSAEVGLYYFHILPFSLYVVSSAANIIALQYYNNKKILTGTGLFLIITPLAFYLNNPVFDLWNMIIFHCIIVSYFFYFMLKYMYGKKSINLYFIVLIVYELSLIFKMVTLLTDIKTGMVFFQLTTIFELLVCLYFILFNIENSPRYRLIKT